MKRVLLLGIPLLAVSLLGDTPNLTPAPLTLVKTFTFSPGDFEIETDSEGYQRIRHEHGVSISPPGAPEMPTLVVWFNVPEGYLAQDASVLPLTVENLQGTFHVRSAADLGQDRKYEGSAQTPSYAPTVWYPEVPARISHGRIRGQDVAGILVTPLQILGASGQLRLATAIQVSLTLQPDTRDPNDLVRIHRDSYAGSVDRLALLQRLGVQPREAEVTSADLRKTFSPKINSGAPFEPTFRPTVDGSPVEMVIITDDAQAAEYQRLADFKTQIGVPTVVRTLSWIQANYHQGVDTQETIRFFLRDAVANWGALYVLLGGDTEVIPVRRVQPSPWYEDPQGIVSDLYYSDLDGTWDEDGDHIFGEMYGYSAFPGDNVDLYPDIYVGRLPSKTQAEAQVLADKVLNYTRAPPPNFATHSLLLGEVLFPQNYDAAVDSVLFDGAELCDDIPTNYFPLQFTVATKLLYENYPAWSGSYPESTQSVIAEINTGYNLVHHVGHGQVGTMAVGLHSSTLGNADATYFTNGSRQGVMYAATCAAGRIDANCIAEAWLLNATGGATAVVAASHLNAVPAGWDYQREWYQALFGDNLGTLGRITSEAKVPLIPYSQYYQIYRETEYGQFLLGDPEMWFWTDDPEPLEISSASTRSLGDANAYLVTVTAASGPVDSARVCLYKADDAYSIAWTDASGIASLSFDPDLPGSFTIGAWAPNYIAAVETVQVVAPDTDPYLFPVSQGIDDDSLGGSLGNADGSIDAGETVELRIQVTNGGPATETGLTATFTTSDGYLTVLDGACAYPAVAPADTVAPLDTLLVSVARGTPDRHEAHCAFTVTGSSGTYEKDLILYIHAPVFEYYGQAISDTVGNGSGDGVISANEDFTIVPSIRNLGLGEAKDIEARLRSSDPAVTISDSVAILGSIAPDQVASDPGDPFELQLSDVTGPHELHVVLVDAYAEVYSHAVDWLVPAAPVNVKAYGEASAIKLTWDPVADPDLAGYNVYRTPGLSPPDWQRINDLTTPLTAYYHDEALPPLTRYYYQIAAMDSSGNEGLPSTTISATTTLPLHDGFPVTTQVPAPASGITFYDLDGDGSLEIITGGEELYVLHADGSEFLNGDQDVRTIGPFSNTGHAAIWNTPAVGDLDHDGSPEIAAATWSPAKLYVWDVSGNVLPGFPKDLNPDSYFEPNPVGSVSFADIDADGDLEIFVECVNYLFAWHHDGTEVLDGDQNPATDGVFRTFGANYNYGTPSFADLDGDVLKEVIAPSRDGKLYVIKGDGTDVPGFPFETTGDITSSPAIGDIDGDGRLEVVFGTSGDGGSPGSGTAPSRSRPVERKSALGLYSPRIALHLGPYPVSKGVAVCGANNLTSCNDLVTEGQLQTPYYAYVVGVDYNPSYGVAGAEFGVSYDDTPGQGLYLCCWAACAALQFPTAGWPGTGTGNRITWNPNGSDPYTGCQTDSVAVAGYFYVYAYSDKIFSLTPHPDTQQGVVVNCSGDSQILESGDFGAVGFGTATGTNPCLETPLTSGAVHALRVDLTEPPGWPVAVPLDADTDPSPALGDINNDGTLDVVIGSTDGHLYVLSGSDGSPLPGFPLMVGSPVSSSPVLADIDNDGYLEVFFGDNLGYQYGVASSGAILDGFPILAGSNFGSSAAVYDIDADGLAEEILRSQDQRIYRWDMPTSLGTSVAWPMFKRTPTNDGNLGTPLFPSVTGIPDARQHTLQVLPPYPNPFRSSATLRFYLSPRALGKDLRFTVFSVTGRLVYSADLHPTTVGWHTIIWPPTSTPRSKFASGAYYAQLSMPTGKYLWRLILTR